MYQKICEKRLLIASRYVCFLLSYGLLISCDNCRIFLLLNGCQIPCKVFLALRVFGSMLHSFSICTRNILILIMYNSAKEHSKEDGKWQRYNKVIKVIIDSIRQSMFRPSSAFPVPNKIKRPQPQFFFIKKILFSHQTL